MKSDESFRDRTKACEACGGEVRLREPCEICLGTGVREVRCGECSTWKGVAEFFGRGKLLRNCRECRMRRWGTSFGRATIDGVVGPPRVGFCESSRNRKTGPIPVTFTSRETCPVGCPWREGGCYAENHLVGMHWRRLSTGRGLSWEAFIDRLKEMSAGQLWRHNEAGDLPGRGDVIDGKLFEEMLEASRHTRGFTYTHKPVCGSGLTESSNRGLIAGIMDRGFVVNLSADGLEHADALAELGVAPVVVVVPKSAGAIVKTPAGRRVVVCPALKRVDVTCETCQLCAQGRRTCIVSFPAHGALAARVSMKLSQVRMF